MTFTRLAFVAASAILLSGTSLWAHSNHNHGSPTPIAKCKKVTACVKDEASQAGVEVIPMLIKAGKIDASWNGIHSVDSVEERGGEWVVSFVNSAEKDAAKKKLYVFITKTGVLSGANFSGK